MARPGISYLDVAKTAIKLVEQKIYPSIEEIRKSLGTGSNSTINKYLREWRSKNGNQAELEQGLPESLLIAIRGIYDGIQEAATNKISLIENESAHAITELRVRLAEVETEHAKFMQTNTTLENSVQEQKEENLALQRQLGKLEVEINKKTDASNMLDKLLANKQSELETLKHQLKNVQNNLDHYREATRQTREIENNLLNDKIKNLEKQAYQQQVMLTKSTEEAKILSNQIKLFEEQKLDILQDLNEKATAIQEKNHLIQHQTTIHNDLSERHENILFEKVKLTNELNASKKDILSLKISLEKAQERITMLEYALEKVETKVTVVNDKNLFLSQEKAELSFQLKQIQSSRC